MINLCLQGCGSNKKDISVTAADIHSSCSGKNRSTMLEMALFPYV
jgi:hypothetical protein